MQKNQVLCGVTLFVKDCCKRSRIKLQKVVNLGVAHDNRDDGGEHAHGRPRHHAALVVVAREVACRWHHEDARGKDGDLQKHAAPPEGGAFEREGEPTLEMDEQAHLNENAAKDKQQKQRGTRILAQFHKSSRVTQS